MDKEQLNNYYQKLIDQLTEINNKISNLNDQHSATLNLFKDSLIIDNKVIGEDVLQRTRSSSNNIHNEIMYQLIPDLKNKIK